AADLGDVGRIITHDVQDRTEHFTADLIETVELNYRRTEEIAAELRDVELLQQFRFGLHTLDVLIEIGLRFRIYDRADVRARIGGIADDEAIHGAEQGFEHCIRRLVRQKQDT